tara:strand:- start:2287 stop:3939 length:1653 start_codon:yes stop_codon:yes gene_type:complete
MLFAFIFNILTYLIIIGFSHIFLTFFYKKSFFYISNLDIFYGLFFLFICSNFINIFFAINKFQYLIIIIGLFSFYDAYKKKILRINFINILILILIFTFISFYSVSNVDSPMYHLQILKWLITDKAVFGLSNLEIRFGTNSSWHSIIAILNIDFMDYSSKHYLSAIVIAIGLNEIFSQKKNNNKFSFFYLNISFVILILFSLIHPFKNGVILNHLGNPELDIAPMVFFILAIYVLINFYNKKDDDNLFYLYCVLSFICITSRILYAPLILPILFKYFKSFHSIEKKDIILIFASFLWFIKSFINSGCLIFPYKFTCINTSWSPGIENINYFFKEAMSYARDTLLRSKYKDFEYTLSSTDWLLPWYKQYFLPSALLNIFTIILIGSSILFFYCWIKRFLNKEKFTIINNDKLIFFILILTLVIWFSAPEIRLGWGVLIAFPAFIFSYSFYLNFEEILKKSFVFKSLILIQILLTGLFLEKNIKYFKYEDLFIIKTKNFNYSNIEKLGIYDDYQIYVSKNWQCAEFKAICLNKPRKNYKIKEIYGYKIINGE